MRSDEIERQIASGELISAPAAYLILLQSTRALLQAIVHALDETEREAKSGKDLRSVLFRKLDVVFAEFDRNPLPTQPRN